MPRLYFVRHGRAAATFAEAADPGLDALGRSQAEAVAARLSPMTPRLLLSSPMKRARETSEPLAARWNARVALEPRVSEIPSPSELGLAERVEWLRSFLAGTWRDAPPGLLQWRDDVIAAIRAVKSETVIFSHYIVINVVAGAAAADDRVTFFRPDNCSVTILDVDDGNLKLVERGHEAETKVN